MENNRQFVEEFRNAVKPHILNFKAAMPWADELQDEEFIELCCKAEKAQAQRRDIRKMWIANLHRSVHGDMVNITMGRSYFSIANSPFSLSYAYKRASKAITGNV
jgi:hypothetical protein